MYLNKAQQEQILEQCRPFRQHGLRTQITERVFKSIEKYILEQQFFQAKFPSVHRLSILQTKYFFQHFDIF